MSGDEVWVSVRPHDTVQVRDGREFDAGADSRAETVRPRPSTMGGAIAAAYGGDQEAIRGPVLARRSGHGWESYFPAPADLAVDGNGDEVWRARPRALEAATDLDAALSLHGRAGLRPLREPEAAVDPAPLAGWLPGAGLERYLHGTLAAADDPVPYADLDLAEEEPLVVEARVGLARTPARTARIGFLYQSTHWRVRDDWTFAAQVLRHVDRPAAPSGPVRFGGCGRLADVTEVTGLDWPKAPDDFPGGRVLVYVATPAVWPGGWLPPLPEEATLVGAAVGEPEPVATASPGGGYRSFRDSRALYWAVPAGSVYLLSFEHGAAEWAKKVHGRALAPAARPRLDTAGFGVVLTGVWS